MRKLFYLLFHKHEYKLCVLRAPHQDVVLLKCIHCGRCIVEILCKEWDS